ncbi:hypothetical protein QBC34DRAFT_424142 [Podospora aff. communis PSN243]|uniref:NACHT domain-containing protein n=1 Tax=Podospora aff. communis PSN243 TaxID=3040156 RepID=A0AAV9GUE8_9PEZI|nr:hypothetical protein QBC34DRAFT_424142 [Podospora aff. communis PSN243]
MDPLSTLSIVAGIVQFVDFGARLFTHTHELYRSASGQTRQIANLQDISTDLSQLAQNIGQHADSLKASTPTKDSSEDILWRICVQCQDVSTALQDAIEQLGPQQCHEFWFGKGFGRGLKGTLSQRRRETWRDIASAGWCPRSNRPDSRNNQNTESLLELLERKSSTSKSQSAFIETTDEAHPSADVEHSDNFCTEAISKSLHFTGADSRQNAIPKAYQETYEWVFEEPSTDRQGTPASQSGFKQWLSGDSDDIYWITGKPGAGKSTMMKFIVEHPSLKQYLGQWSADSGRPVMLASFYFWNAGPVSMQKSQEGLLRQLLAQCLQQLPTLAARACPRRWALVKILGRGAAQRAPAWSWEELTESFSIISLMLGDSFNMALFVDGLDEFHGQHTKLLSFIKLIHSRPGTKVCVSSRPWNVFLDAFGCNPKLRMEEITADDITLFINGEFLKTPAFRELRTALPAEAATLIDKIAQKAQGVFLWVSIVVLLIREGLSNGDSLNNLQQVLDSLPTDLSELYHSIWNRVPKRYLGHASSLFRIHACSTRPLDAVVFWLADEDSALKENINDLTDDDISNIESRKRREHITQTMTRRLNSRTSGLLEISKDGTVDYLHRTVRDWIDTIWPDVCAKSPPNFDPHLQLLKALTVESSRTAIWAYASAGMPSIFWTRVGVCFYHAAKVIDCPANLTLFVNIMDRLDTDLGVISTTYPYLYRNFAPGDLAQCHWSTTQYTMTNGSKRNSFVGLAAQFAVLPYVRHKVSANLKLLRHDPEELSILSCAVLGFNHFSRPDVADTAVMEYGEGEGESWANRLELVKFLLSKGSLKSGGKNGVVRDQDVFEEVKKRVEMFQCVASEDVRPQAEEASWNPEGFDTVPLGGLEHLGCPHELQNPLRREHGVTKASILRKASHEAQLLRITQPRGF